MESLNTCRFLRRLARSPLHSAHPAALAISYNTMKLITPVLLALSLPSLGLAQQLDPQNAWDQFQVTNGSDWRVQWNPATGTPKAIYGPGLKLSGEVGSLAAARAEATTVLNRFSALLGRGHSTFVETIGTKAQKVYVFVYDQTFGGLPVINGRADIRIHEIGAVSMFGSSAVQIPNGFSLTPTISAAQAKVAAEMHVLGTKSVENAAAPKLVIWADTDSQTPSTPTLAFEVQIDQRPTAPIVGKAYVSATNGSIVKFQNEVYDCLSCGTTHVTKPSTGRHADRMESAMAKVAKISSPAPSKSMIALTGKVMAWTNLGILPVSPLTNTPLGNLQVTSSAGSTFTDANGNFSIAYTGSGPVTVTATLQGRHSQRIRCSTGTQMTATASVTPGTAATLQFGNSSMNELNRSQTTTYWHLNDANVWLRGLVPGSTGPMNTISNINPRVNINSNCNAYYTSNTINFYTSGGGCNMTAYQTVIVHEWGHGLDAVFGGISQTDGLSEGWGDILGLYRSGQPELGAGFRTGTTNGIRSGLNTRRYPAGGGVHQQGETWMGWAWDLRVNLIASLGAGPGAARAEEIVVSSIVADATNQPDAVREVFILDDDDGNLNNGTPNYLDLEKASLKRNLPYPKRTNPNAASFTYFGKGCQGTGKGPSYCLSNNTSGGSLTNTRRSNEYAYQVLNTTARTITGFEVFTASTGSTVRVNTAVYADNGSGSPSTTPLATGTMTVGATPGFYQSTMSANIPAGNFYVSLDHSAQTTYLAALTSGSPGIAFWRRPPMGTGAFSRSSLVSQSGFRILCAGGGSSAVPEISNNGLPEIGQTYQISIAQGPANAPASLVNGLSNTTWGSVPLPFSLAPLGAPGCNLLTAPVFSVGIALDASGNGTLSLSVPNVPAYFGLQVYHQFYVVDPGANAMGIAVSRGGVSKVGQR